MEKQIVHTDEMMEFIQKGLMAYAFNLTRDMDDARDLIQDTCLKFLENHSRYAHLPLGEQKALANVMLKNLFLDGQRLKKRRPRILTDEYPVDYGRSPDYDSGELLTKILQKEDHNTRMVVLWAEGHKVRELAKRFGTCKNNVSAYILRARRRLKEEFAGEFVHAFVTVL